MQRTIAAMVAGRRRWLERMQRAKSFGLIAKVPTGRRRPRVTSARTKAIARARSIAYRAFEASPKIAVSPEEMSLAAQLEELQQLALRLLLSILDHPAGDSLESQRLQAKIAMHLLSACK